MNSVEDVRLFWEANPLMAGECPAEPGTRAYFEFQKDIFINDAFAGSLDPRFFPADLAGQRVLDLGCGPGFWPVEFWQRGCREIVAVDLTERAVELTRRRCQLYDVQAVVEQGNAERLHFPDGSFSHVNCQGVIHHTPNTGACVREIARVLRPGGTASISVYYRNLILKAWPLFRWPARVIALLGGRLTGRGRERIFTLVDVDEIVRTYDGRDNPIGKSYSRAEFQALLVQYFHVEEFYLHYFPARALPFRIPRTLHRALDRHLGFMIFATVTKR